MKNIFWTTVVWIGLVGLFGIYVRFFNSHLGTQISHLIAEEPNFITQTGTVCDSSKDILLINARLDMIDQQLANIMISLENNTKKEATVSEEVTPTTVVNTPAQKPVQLYYFNDKTQRLELFQQ